MSVAPVATVEHLAKLVEDHAIRVFSDSLNVSKAFLDEVGFKTYVENDIYSSGNRILMKLGEYRCMAHIDDLAFSRHLATLASTVEDMATQVMNQSPYKSIMNTTLELQLFHYRLGRRLKYMVESVERSRNPSTFEDTLIVKFKNGHTLKTTPEEIDSDEFYATCLLMYDLPPRINLQDG